nr:carbohydrate kinase family protein [Chloroflexota bacterium]
MPGSGHSRQPRIAAVGMASWDRFAIVEQFPLPGTYAVVLGQSSQPGGTTANTAIGLARLEAQVAIAAVVGDDTDGRALVATLQGAGVDTTWVMTRPGAASDSATVIVSRDPIDRTILWHRGAHLVRGDCLDIAALFGHDLLLVDVADPSLRRFLVDLPAHTQPNARLLGTLTYLVDNGGPGAFDLALRFDALTGNKQEFQLLTGTSSATTAIAAIQSRMRGSNLRAAAMSTGAEGCLVWTATDQWRVPAFPIQVIDATGAGDAFAAGVAY